MCNNMYANTNSVRKSWRSDVPPHPAWRGASHGWVPVVTHSTPVPTPVGRLWVARNTTFVCFVFPFCFPLFVPFSPFFPLVFFPFFSFFPFFLFFYFFHFSPFFPFFSFSSLFSVLLLPSSFFILPSSFVGKPFSVKHFAYAASAVLCLICQVVMAQQHSWKLYDDWKEFPHSRSSYGNQRRSNNKSSYGWKWKPWTCQSEGCRGWVYDHQKRSFCPQCIGPLPEPTPAKSPSVEPMCSPCGENC